MLLMREMSLLQQISEHRCWPCRVPFVRCRIRKIMDRRLRAVGDEMLEASLRPMREALDAQAKH